MMDDKSFYYDIAKFEVQAIAQRNSVLLVFQSMLFAATALVSGKQGFIPDWFPIVPGAILSVVWLYLNYLTYVIEDAAMKKLINRDSRIVELLAVRNQNWLLRQGSVSKMMAFMIPSIMLASWVALALFKIFE